MPGNVGSAVVTFRVILSEEGELQHLLFVLLENVNPASQFYKKEDYNNATPSDYSPLLSSTIVTCSSLLS